MARQQMRLTPELVSRVQPYTGAYGPEADTTRDDPKDQALADAIMKAAPSGEVWIFAFGSLIWKPGPEFGERRPGIIRGWHRAFCLGWDRAFRGNPVNPGLMLSLDRGGQCRGVALKLRDDEPGVRANLLAILRREPPFPTRWATVRTAAGDIRAIAFTNDRKGPVYVGGLSDEEIADALAKSTGKFGSMAEYVHHTIEKLDEFGIHDAHLWRMQELIAERLERAAGPAA